MTCLKLFFSAGAVALCALFGGQSAWAQSHEQASARHVLRSSVVSTFSIPEASAAAHGIQRAADRAILNVTVLKKGSQLMETVPAKVQAHAISLAGSRRDIKMTETKAGDWVSYTGTFTFAPREVLDFTIVAEPVADGEKLELRYRERVWVDQKAP